MARTVKEWIGRTADSKIPDSVKSRIREKQDQKCAISERPFQTGDMIEYDHVIPLRDWIGEGHGNREGNLQAILAAKHKIKTAIENSKRAKVKRTKMKHEGTKRPKQSMQSAPFARSEKAERKANRAPKPSLPPRQIYQENE
jgi:5-methylcytosine-specific restriction protein A